MKIQYFPETDTLAIELSDRAVVETEAITEDLILDYDDQGKVVAITLDNYSKLDLGRRSRILKSQ
ncbi:DUF2283 domain-containing protein [Prochlorothrix hollandica]|uniref:DUF2283 domain-containing protein n=1 Tax=Prochlorothrix hollandica TaxID=1223 RepID=UPI00333F2DDB